MDIQYLLFLQELRNATGGIFDELFNVISKIAVDIMPILPYLIFWAIDKNWGYRFFSVLWGGELVNGTIKLTACAYRPWIRDVRIEPAGDSKIAATGYSFPSGHTMCATAMYGTTSVWQYKKRRPLAILCMIMILLTGFSRNFLGVHTPQDVIVGFVETVIIIWETGAIGKKISGNTKLTDILTLIGVFVVAAVLIYIKVKEYPMDYVDGELLVDPQKMMPDTFKAAGGFLGFMIGSYIERHYVKYRIPERTKSLPVLACVGTAIIYVYITLVNPISFKVWFGAQWGNFIAYIIMMIFAVAIYPIIIMKATSNEKENMKDIE
ncbi:MAG: phosphatase PAP2 family protein [Firmicutes bacterium]|nr:phosphatase PAP2 family protein [Bacillota bacterium]